MSKHSPKVLTPAQEAPQPTLEELLAKAKELAEAAALLQAEAEKPDATDETKAAAAKASEDATAAGEAAAVAQKAADDAAAEAAAQREAEEQAAQREATEAAARAAAPETASADPEDDPKFVPILRDEDGERIPRNSIVRLVTTTGLNLRSLDGELITPEPTMELKGPDVRKGDWYTVQFQAGLLAVHSTKKIR